MNNFDIKYFLVAGAASVFLAMLVFKGKKTNNYMNNMQKQILESSCLYRQCFKISKYDGIDLEPL